MMHTIGPMRGASLLHTGLHGTNDPTLPGGHLNQLYTDAVGDGDPAELGESDITPEERQAWKHSTPG